MFVNYNLLMSHLLPTYVGLYAQYMHLRKKDECFDLWLCLTMYHLNYVISNIFLSLCHC